LTSKNFIVVITDKIDKGLYLI